jgi:MFS family permease
VLAVLFVVYVFNFIDRRLPAILLEDIKKDLGASDTVMGLLTGPAFVLFYTMAGVFIAVWADRGVRRSIIALGLAGWSAMTAISGLAQSVWHLTLCRFGVGLGEAACSPPAHSLISDYYPPSRRATALSVYSMGIYVGILLSYALGGLLGSALDWRWAFVIVGSPGLALALVVRFTVREPVRGEAEGRSDTGARASIREVFRFLWPLPSFRHLAIGSALNSFVSYALGIWLPAFLIRVHGMDKADVGGWLGLTFGLGGAAGVLLGGFLCDRLGARDPRWQLRVPAIATLLSFPFSVAVLLWPDRSTALALLAPAIVLHAVYLGPVFSITQGLAPLRMRALAASVLILVMNLIGYGAGPPAVGFLSDLLDRHTSLGVESIRYALLATMVLRIWAVLHFWLGSHALGGELTVDEGR